MNNSNAQTEMIDKKKNIVFLNAELECYRYMFDDFVGQDNILYIDKECFPETESLRGLYRWHFKGLNRKIPFKILWMYILENRIKRWNKRIDAIVFIGLDFVYYIEKGLLDRLKKTYPDITAIFYYGDLVETKRKYDIGWLRKRGIQNIICFDKRDSEKYSVSFRELVLSYRPVESRMETYDVFFVGAAKSRLDTIIQCFERLHHGGCKCKFIIVTDDTQKRKYEDLIEYRDTYIGYDEVLQYVSASKCLLEVIQEGGSSYTLRTAEAAIYNKRLLTNNPSAKATEWYSEDCVQVFHNAVDIDCEWCRRIPSGEWPSKAHFSPQRFLDKVYEMI